LATCAARWRRSPGDARGAGKAQVDAPLVAVDVVIFTIDQGALKALLVEVRNGPCAGSWAFPGGRVPAGEAPERTAERELRAQTGIRDLYLEQLRTFGDPQRDPRAHVVSVGYFALLPDRAP